MNAETVQTLAATPPPKSTAWHYHNIGKANVRIRELEAELAAKAATTPLPPVVTAAEIPAPAKATQAAPVPKLRGLALAAASTKIKSAAPKKIDGKLVGRERMVASFQVESGETIS